MEKKNITLTKEQVFTLGNNLIYLLNENFENIPVKLDYALRKNAQTIIEIGTELNKQRMDVLNEFGTEDKETGVFSFTEENEKLGNEKLKEIFDGTVDIEYLEIPIDLFDGINMSSSQIANISFMIGE